MAAIGTSSTPQKAYSEPLLKRDPRQKIIRNDSTVSALSRPLLKCGRRFLSSISPSDSNPYPHFCSGYIRSIFEHNNSKNVRFV